MSISTREKSNDFYIKADYVGANSNNRYNLYEPDVNLAYEHDNVVSEDSGRDENGVTHIEWIRRDIAKVSLTYTALTGSELRSMKKMLQGKEFELHYIECGEHLTMQKAYCGKCSYKLLTSNYYGTGEELYTDVSFNIVEE